MGSDRHFAWQQSSGPNVRFVPKADIHRGKERPYSSTSSAMAFNHSFRNISGSLAMLLAISGETEVPATIIKLLECLLKVAKR